MVNLSDKNLQKIGGVSAIVSTASYIFGIGLFAMMMTPLNNPGQAEIFKIFLANISLGIDISDKYLGSLWIAMVSFAAIKNGSFPLYTNIIGLVISIPALLHLQNKSDSCREVADMRKLLGRNHVEPCPTAVQSKMEFRALMLIYYSTFLEPPSQGYRNKGIALCYAV